MIFPENNVRYFGMFEINLEKYLNLLYSIVYTSISGRIVLYFTIWLFYMQ